MIDGDTPSPGSPPHLTYGDLIGFRTTLIFIIVVVVSRLPVQLAIAAMNNAPPAALISLTCHKKIFLGNLLRSLWLFSDQWSPGDEHRQL